MACVDATRHVTTPTRKRADRTLPDAVAPLGTPQRETSLTSDARIGQCVRRPERTSETKGGHATMIDHFEISDIAGITEPSEMTAPAVSACLGFAAG
jgi:hypothetical protein